MDASIDDAKLLAIGRLVGTHGVRGELKLLTFNPESEAIVAGSGVTLRQSNLSQSRVIRSVRPHKRLLLVIVEGCDSMTAAEALVGAEVCVDANDLPESGPNELYHYELMGMDVVTVDGKPLGQVVEIIETGANDVCTVRGQGREYMIPLIDDVVKTIDKQSRCLVIDPLPGLLDL